LQLSQRARDIKESQIREASRYCVQFGAINLAQGLPDFAAPIDLKAAAAEAIAQDYNQYADTWGLASLRVAIADKMHREQGVSIDPDGEVTVCCGATEGLNLALMALIDPGDRVLVFEPFYENYIPNLATVGGCPVFVTLQPPTWDIDPDVLLPLFQRGLRAVILNTPANPTGKVWTLAELHLIADLCDRFGTYLITDEIYEYILYGETHHCVLKIPQMRERAIVVNGFSKTFCVTGWRLGYAIANPQLTAAMRRIHDFLTICAPTPLQHAAVTAMGFGATYFANLAADYQRKRDILFPVLAKIGLSPVLPKGAYYIWTDSTILAPEANAAALRLAREAKVAAVPGNCFSNPERTPVSGLRFCFAKKDSTLQAAAEHLLRLG
jgi:aminotransferase